MSSQIAIHRINVTDITFLFYIYVRDLIYIHIWQLKTVHQQQGEIETKTISNIFVHVRLLGR